MSKPASFEEVRLSGLTGELAGIRLASGEQPALAVHGWLDNAASFIPLAPFLSGLDCIALDLPGHGRSAPRPPGGFYHLTDYLNDMDRALESLDWPACYLIGHSLGASLSCLYAAAKRREIKGVVMIDGFAPFSAGADTAAENLHKALAAPEGLDAAEAKRMRGYPDWQSLIDSRHRAGRDSLSPENCELLVRRAALEVDGCIRVQSDPRLKWPSPVRFMEAQIEALVAAVSCPMLVIDAEEGLLSHFPPQQAEARLALFAKARRVTLPGRHHLHMQTPQPVGEAIGQFIGSSG